MVSAPSCAAEAAAAVPAGPPPTTSTSQVRNTGMSRAGSRIVCRTVMASPSSSVGRGSAGDSARGDVAAHQPVEDARVLVPRIDVGEILDLAVDERGADGEKGLARHARAPHGEQPADGAV